MDVCYPKDRELPYLVADLSFQTLATVALHALTMCRHNCKKETWGSLRGVSEIRKLELYGVEHEILKGRRCWQGEETERKG